VSNYVTLLTVCHCAKTTFLATVDCGLLAVTLCSPVAWYERFVHHRHHRWGMAWW